MFSRFKPFLPYCKVSVYFLPILAVQAFQAYNRSKRERRFRELLEARNSSHHLTFVLIKTGLILFDCIYLGLALVYLNHVFNMISGIGTEFSFPLLF